MTDLNLTFRLMRFPAAAEACEILDFTILLPCPFWAWVLFSLKVVAFLPFLFSWPLTSYSICFSCCQSEVFEHLALPIFTTLLYQIKEAQGWAVLWHISKEYCGQTDGTKIWVDKTKNLCKAEAWPAWLFYSCFWVPRIFETGRNAIYT